MLDAVFLGRRETVSYPSTIGAHLPQRDPVSGLLVRNPATDSIISHSENDPTDKCDPIGIFQNSLFIAGSTVCPIPWVAASAGAHPDLLDEVVDAISVLDRTKPGIVPQHTGVIITSGGTSYGTTTKAGLGGNVSIVENSSVLSSLGSLPSTAISSNDVLFAPAGGPCIAVNTGAPPVSGHIYSDVIIAGPCSLSGTSFQLFSTGGIYLGPGGQLLLNGATDGAGLTVLTRGSPIIQGLIDATGQDSHSAAVGPTSAAGNGGAVSISSTAFLNFMVPTIVTAGGNSSSSSDLAGGLGGNGGNIVLSGGNGHLFIGGGTGSTTSTSVPPLLRANFNLSLAPPPVTVGDYLPARPPFNLISVGTIKPIANVETHLQKLPTQLGFTRGFLTSGGMGGFGIAPVGSGGNGGSISLSSSASGIWRANVVRMCERIGHITGELRAFSRKSTGASGPVPLKAALDASIMLNRSRLRDNPVRLTRAPIDPKLQIVGRRVRLEQVVVILLQNAYEALESTTDHDSQGLADRVGAYEAEIIRETLNLNHGNAQAAMRRLKLARKTSTTNWLDTVFASAIFESDHLLLVE